MKKKNIRFFIFSYLEIVNLKRLFQRFGKIILNEFWKLINKFKHYEKYPFKYLVINDFLDKFDFDNLRKKIENIKEKEKKISFNWLDYQYTGLISFPEGKIIEESSILTKEEMLNLYSKYEPPLRDMLIALAPHKRKFYDHFQILIIKTPKEKIYKVHDDIARKLLSVVIYIHPKENLGTFIHKKSDLKILKEIKWKPNRMFAFSRLEGKTLHSFRGNKVEDRYALILNLMTSKPNQARFSEDSFISKFTSIKVWIGKLYFLIKLKFIKLIKKFIR